MPCTRFPGAIFPTQRLETFPHCSTPLPSHLGDTYLVSKGPRGPGPCRRGLGVVVPPADAHPPDTSLDPSHSPVGTGGQEWGSCKWWSWGPPLSSLADLAAGPEGTLTHPSGSSPPVESQMLPTAGGLACLAQSPAWAGGGFILITSFQLHAHSSASSFSAFPITRLLFSARILRTDFLQNRNSSGVTLWALLFLPSCYFLHPVGPPKGKGSIQLPLAAKTPTSAPLVSNGYGIPLGDGPHSRR